MDIASFLEDKKTLLMHLMKSIETNEKIINGLSSMKERGFSNEGMIEKLIQTSVVQMQQLNRLSAMMIIYVQGSNFNKNVAEAMSKMGRGEEALDIMINNKFKQQ